METSEFLKSLSYRNSVRWAVRSLHLQRFLRKQYYAWARPADGIVRWEIGGISAQFSVRTPGELRVLDPAGQAQDERHLLELLISTLHRGDFVYDIGANVGLYSVILGKAVGAQGQVIAFEPGSVSCEHLRENAQANCLWNVRCFQMALGERSTQAKLYHGEENADSSLVRSPTGVDMGYEIVEVAEGDRLVKSEKLPVPRLVKIDVEGSEYAVLRGLRRTLGQPACEIVCCEIHPHFLPQDVKPEEILALLESLGFCRIDIRRRRDTFHALCFKESSPPAEQ